VRLICPPGWSAEPDELALVLPPGEYLDTAIALRAPADPSPGLYPVRAELTVAGRGVPAPWRQPVEDVCVVSVGAPRAAELLRLVSGPESVRVRAGATAPVTVTIATQAAAPVAVEAHLISPWGTWEWIGPAVVGTELHPGSATPLSFEVSPPPWAQPGRWWALVRLAAAGCLVYSPAVSVEVVS
jgi:hypothetical protein